MYPKPWYQSKTLWFNGISLLLVIAGVLADQSLVSDARIIAGATAFMTVGNAALRIWFTSEPLTERTAKQAMRQRQARAMLNRD